MNATNAMTKAHPQSARSEPISGIITLVTLVGLNVTFVAFFTLWSIADSATVNRMESISSYDPTLMLPNAHLTWIFAYASLVLLIAVDGSVLILYTRLRKARTRS